VNKKQIKKEAIELHENVPPDWYFRSIKENIFQRYWHKRRFKEVSKLVEPTGGNILDIGSADGVFTKLIQEKSKADSALGIEVLEASVSWAKKHWKTPKIEFRVADAENLDFKAGTFDAVFAIEVLEHIYSPKEMIKKVKKILKKGGYAVFLVPTDSLLFEIIWFFWTKLRGRIWKETHIQSFKNDFLTRICQKVGFKIEEDRKFILGMLQVIKVRKV